MYEYNNTKVHYVSTLNTETNGTQIAYENIKNENKMKIKHM